VIFILSAKYGLIESEQKIPYYDRRLSIASAPMRRPQVLETAKCALRSHRWRAIGLCAGKEYLSVLHGLDDLMPTGARFNLLAGGLGKRLTALRNWLRQ